MKQAHTPFRSVLAIVLLGTVAAGCFSLGLWQLGRAAERDALHDAIERGRLQAPVVLSAESPSVQLTPWRPAVARGTWSDAQTVLLENRNLEGRPGYWVATPLLLQAGEPSTAVLVLRGWLPRDMQTGSALPAVPQEPGLVEIRGELHAHVPRIFELWDWAGGRSSELPAQLPTPDGTIPQTQNLELADFAQATGLKLLPTVLAQTSDTVSVAPAGRGSFDPDRQSQSSPAPMADAAHAAPTPGAPTLRREWPGPSLDSDQNRGYALQWFSFSAIAAVAAAMVARGALRTRARRGSNKDAS